MAKSLTGFVTSDKNNKTIVVKVVTKKIHPIYKKRYVTSKKYQAHDENNTAKKGDLVSIIEHKPISATKHFMLDKVIRKAGVEVIDEEPEI